MQEVATPKPVIPSVETCEACKLSYVGVPVIKIPLPEQVGALCCSVCGCSVKLMPELEKMCPNPGGPVYG